MTVAMEKPQPRRRWKAWAILERDETFYRLSMEGPEESQAIRTLVKTGWIAVPVEVIEINHD
jgi:hypothetical protein